MNEDRERAALRRVLRLIAEHLEEFLEGDELALERLGASLEQGGFEGEELHAAVLALRGFAAERTESEEIMPVEGAPGRSSQRILSREERESLSPEAWGYLLALAKRGALDREQLERVLDRLATSGMRLVDVETAHEVAVRVAMPEIPDTDHGQETDVAH